MASARGHRKSRRRRWRFQDAAGRELRGGRRAQRIVAALGASTPSYLVIGRCIGGAWMQ